MIDPKPSRWLVQSPKGAEFAVANLDKFAAGRGKQGWTVTGQTVLGHDRHFPEPLTEDELAKYLTPVDADEDDDEPSTEIVTTSETVDEQPASETTDEKPAFIFEE